MIQDHDEATIELAVLMRRMPEEIESMNYMDSIAWLERYSKRDRAEKRFDAALHGRELR